MNFDLDSKISFVSGGGFTILMAGPIYDGAIVLLMGIVGGFGGVFGKEIYYRIKDYIKKKKTPNSK
jgi:hypothetical protein